MTTTSQSTVRTALVDALTQALMGDGQIVQYVYNGLPSDFGTQVPVVMVTDDGNIRRARDLNGTRYKTIFKEIILIWVADADSSAGWSDTDAEDQIAIIEASIADYIAANRHTDVWNFIGHGGESLPDTLADEGGKSYLVLAIPISVEVVDG